jgi:hypothetical protein
MNELISLIKDNFSTFVEVMFFIPTRFKVWYWSEAVVLIIILAVAVGVIFLSDRLMRKYSLGFPASVLLTFLVLSLTLGLTGFFLSIPRLFESVNYTFPIVCVGSPVFNLILSVIASFGSRLRNHRPIAGILLLLVAGLLFAYIFFSTFIVFLWPLINN